MRRLIPPATIPTALTAADAKAHLRVDGSDEDAMIAAWCLAATALAQHETGRALVTQTWGIKLDQFPVGDIALAMPPVASITHIKYLDADGVEQTVDSAAYVLAADPLRPFVRLAYGAAWPAARGDDDSVTITISCGYGAAAAVPEAIVAWIKLHVCSMDAGREAAGAKIEPLPFVASLLDPYRTWGA